MQRLTLHTNLGRRDCDVQYQHQLLGSHAWWLLRRRGLDLPYPRQYVHAITRTVNCPSTAPGLQQPPLGQLSAVPPGLIDQL